MAIVETGWERNKRIVFDDIFAYSNFKHTHNALEIGAGTGKETVPFLNANYDATAVEISQNMADFLLEKFYNYENFHVTVSSFEESVLQENSFDLMYAASAFQLDTMSDHISLPEINRFALYDKIKNCILRHGGYHTVHYIFQLYMGRKL